MKKVIFFSLLILLSACSVFPSSKPAINNDKPKEDERPITYNEIPYNTVDLNTAKLFIDTNPDIIIIDASPNYGQGHIPNAVNYYVGDGKLDKAIPDFDKNAFYLIYCRNGIASKIGAQKLVNAGMKNVYRLEGNYDAWVNAGYDIEI